MYVKRLITLDNYVFVYVSHASTWHYVEAPIAHSSTCIFHWDFRLGHAEIEAKR